MLPSSLSPLLFFRFLFLSSFFSLLSFSSHLGLLSLCPQHLCAGWVLLQEHSERVFLQTHVPDGAGRLGGLLARVDEDEDLVPAGVLHHLVVDNVVHHLWEVVGGRWRWEERREEVGGGWRWEKGGGGRRVEVGGGRRGGRRREEERGGTWSWIKSKRSYHGSR